MVTKNIISDTVLIPIVGPLQKSESGFGFKGCMSYNKSEDKVQCHVCGKWFKHVGAHLKKHGITDDDYRVENGLTFNYPLCGREYSENKRNLVTPQFIKTGLSMRRRLAKARANKGGGVLRGQSPRAK